MRAISIVLALLFCAGVAQAEELMSPRAFRDAGIARIRQFSPNAEVEIRTDLGINVRVPGKEGEQIVNFHNTYALYRSDPAQRNECKSIQGTLDAIQEFRNVVDWVRSRGQLASTAPLVCRNGALTNAPPPER